MNGTPLSATDAFSPAFDRMTTILFKPFRFGKWVRFAVLAILTGELSGGSCNFRVPSNFSGPSHQQNTDSLLAKAPFDPTTWPHFFLIVALVAVFSLVLWLVFLYINSILRFVLFDAVLTGNVGIRQGWRRWQQRGAMFFPWQIGYTIISMLVVAVMLGMPIFLAWRAGIFKNPGQHLAILVLGGLGLLLVLVLLSIVAAAVFVLTKDFVIPIMMFEGVGPIQGWSRLKSMVSASKSSYAVYLLFKLVLAIAAAIGTAIIGAIIVIIILIPFGIVAVALGVGISSLGSGSGMTASVITLIVVGVLLLVCVILTVISFVSVPATVFFQSYALHFFGSRYEPLRNMLYPPPPPQAPPATPLSPLPQPAG